MDLAAFGRILLFIAVGVLLLGLLLIGIGKLTGGRGLPGDFVYRRDGITIYFPLATSILVSIILSVLLALIGWLVNRGR